MGVEAKPDFSGYATKVGLKCSDGRTIMPDAFKHQDQHTVPLVWQHNHDDPGNILGHAVLEYRKDGMYAHAYFNETPAGVNAKTLVQHGDVKFLSIFANQLTEKAKQVFHGIIREVSLVLAGANPGALIDNITLAHADGDMVTLEDEAIIYTGLELQHGDMEDNPAADPDPAAGNSTLQERYEAMSDAEKDVVHTMVGAALATAKSDNNNESNLNHTDNGEGRRMSRNVFEEQNGGRTAADAPTISHDDMRGIVSEARRLGSLKAAVEGYAIAHGIDNIDLLFPDARTVTDTPEFESRRLEWVTGVLNGTKHSPFSRIRTLSADITHEDARAKGYVKGNMKKEEFFAVSRRATTPATVYKKQGLDRDDIIDITDFDVVVWLKAEMRLMLDEEIARAVLIGDGRDVEDEDKIKDPAGSPEGAGIRSILYDHDLYAATVEVDDSASSTDVVDAVISAMGFYKGSGSPTLYTTLPVLTSLLLTRDEFGHRLWRNPAELAQEMGVSDIVIVEAMEDETNLVGIVVNLRDYTLGTDRGGEVNTFDDFDIDYNKYKYLIETRLSGALTKIRSALVITRAPSGGVLLANPEAPTFDEDTSIVTVPNVSHVTYKNKDTDVDISDSTVTLDEGEVLNVIAIAASGYYFADNLHDEWTFTGVAT